MGPRWQLPQRPAGPSSLTGGFGDLPRLQTRCAAERPAPAERGSRLRQGQGPTRGRGRRPGPAGRPHAPGHRHGRRHSTLGRAGPAPGARSADRGSPRPANRTHPATCNVLAEPKLEQGRPGRASARAAAAGSTSAAEREARGRRDARAPVRRGRGAVRTVGANGIAASGLRGRGITPRGGTGTSEAGRGRTLEQQDDQSECGQWDRGRGFILRAGLALFSPGIWS